MASPQRVAVVGAGMVGLSTAWFLQERGAEVAVFDRTGVAAGASWGNAGWLAPALTTPLPEPAVLRYGLRAVLSPRSPVYVPIRPDLALLRFLVGFARHCTGARWRRAMRAYVPLNDRALDAFDLLEAGGVAAPTKAAEPFLACFRTEADRRTLQAELAEVEELGQKVDVEVLDGAEARRREPALTEEVGAALQLHGQRFIDPPRFVAALGTAVQERGGALHTGVTVHSVVDLGGVVALHTDEGLHRFDAVVVATGAELNRLTGKYGVRRLVQAGRGYSFSVPAPRIPAGPIYLPTQRVACTPLSGRLRVAGMMEFRRAGEPLDPRRIRAIADAVRPFLRDLDLDDRRDEWVGSRPCTDDGLPLIGPTRSRRVFAAGGHGMWGIVLGPLTGQLVAEAVLTGRTPPELAATDPLR